MDSRLRGNNGGDEGKSVSHGIPQQPNNGRIRMMFLNCTSATDTVMTAA